MAEEELRAVLHALRLAGFAESDVVAGRAGLDEATTAGLLDRARLDGWVNRREGRLTGWSLTSVGRAEGQRLLAEELDAAGFRGTFELQYEAFLGLNGSFLSLCTDWQLRPVADGGGDPVLNDHSDPDYDSEVVDRLAVIHRSVLPILDELCTRLGRFGGYGHRFRHALSRVEANDVDWFTKPMIDSYHTVWFELHEDLLATLGVDRSGERDRDAQKGTG